MNPSDHTQPSGASALARKRPSDDLQLSTMPSQTRRAQRPPPSPSPPCVSIPSPMDVDSPPSTSTFPSRSPGLLIYFDPTSARARRLSEDLLNFASTSTPIVTAKPSEATHIVLNPFSKFGEDFLRPRPSTSPHPFLSPSSTSRRQYILALRWIEDSIRLEQWQPEESYLYVPRVEEEERLEEVPNQTEGGEEELEVELASPDVAREGVDGVEKESEPVREVAEAEVVPATVLRRKEGSGMAVDPVPEQVVVDDASDDDAWTLSPKATRLASEDEQLARYFASVPPSFDLFARDRQGRDRFDWYTVAVRSERTAEEWRREYRRRDYYFLAMLEILRKEKKLGGGNGKRKADSSSVAGKTTKRSRKQPDGQSSVAKKSFLWTSKEVEDLRLCLRTSTTVQEAAVKFNKLHPYRTVPSASVYYSTHREVFKDDVHHLPHLEPSVRPKPLTNDESDRLAQLYTQLKVFYQAANAYAEENPQHNASYINRWYYSHKEFFDKKVETMRQAQAVSKAKSTPKTVVWTDSLLKEFGFHLSALGNNPEPGFRTFNLKYPGTTIDHLRWLYYSNKFRFQAMFQAMRTDPSLSSFSWSATSNNPPPVPPPPLPTRFAGPYYSSQPSSVASGSKPLYAYSSPTVLPSHPRSAPISQQQAPTLQQQAPMFQQNPHPHPPFLPPSLSSIVRKLPSLPPTLEPPSFLQLGTGPSSSNSSIYCYFCGVGDERAQFIRQIELVQPSRLVCDCCLAALNDRIYEGGAMARMGGTEKLEWVVGVLKVNGMAKRRLKVRVRDGGMALGKG